MCILPKKTRAKKYARVRVFVVEMSKCTKYITNSATAPKRSVNERDERKGSSEHADNKQQQHKIPIKTQVEELKNEVFQAKRTQRKKAATHYWIHVVMKNPPYATRAHFGLPVFFSAENESDDANERVKEELLCCWLVHTAVAGRM